MKRQAEPKTEEQIARNRLLVEHLLAGEYDDIERIKARRSAIRRRINRGQETQDDEQEYKYLGWDLDNAHMHCRSLYESLTRIRQDEETYLDG